jgi:glycosyltransferase involved in cell wall biosynthesis
LSPEKGIDVAIRAVGEIDGAVLDIAGTGPEEASLRRLAESVAPGRVRFHGLVDKTEVQRLMLAASVVVVPSRWYENQPMVVLEALARGAPVVGSALGGMPELIDPGVTGDLVPANDPKALAAALRPYVANPEHAFAMRDSARASIVSEFAPERHLERVDAVYALAARSLRSAAA